MKNQKKEVIHIEICKSDYVLDKEKKKYWCVRIGDIKGSGETSNASLEEVIDEIKDAMEEIK